MNENLSILVVDDDDSFRNALCRELKVLDYRVIQAPTGEEALEILKGDSIDVVLLDIKMPGIGGVECLKIIKESFPTIEVIMLTGHGTIEDAINSMKLGAYDFLTKPYDMDKLEAVIQKALEKRNLVKQNIILKQELNRRDRYQGLIGESLGMKRVLEMINKVANTRSTVLIHGESGVGKELVAKAIHLNSPRKGNPFIVLDCGSLQDSLLESELFGHERGAYTGAISLKHGLFEVADSGTLFLDEIGEISPAMQVKLLRILETGQFRRVGGIKDTKVDVRVVTATHRDLRQMMLEGKFREDLFYRLNVITIYVPPLRERKEDISLLGKHFVENTGITGKQRMKISPEAMELLVNYHWPGNIRELQNTIERAMILSENHIIGPEDLPDELKIKSRPPKSSHFNSPNPYLSLKDLEREHITSLFKELGKNKRKIAKILEISERHLYRKLKEYKLE